MYLNFLKECFDDSYCIYIFPCLCIPGRTLLMGQVARSSNVEGAVQMSDYFLEKIKELQAERRHWKANHDNQVARAALLLQRDDLPVDRIPAYRELERLQAENRALREKHVYLSDEAVSELWQQSWNKAYDDAGLGIGNADVAHMNQPGIFARLIQDELKGGTQ